MTNPDESRCFPSLENQQYDFYNFGPFLVLAPDNWDHAHTDCGGRNQSPINIVTRKTLRDERLTSFQFANYQQVFRGTIKNNGHSGEHIFHLPSAEPSVWSRWVTSVCPTRALTSSGWSSYPEHHLRWKPVHQLQGCAVPPALGQQWRAWLRTHHRWGAVSHGGIHHYAEHTRPVL